LTDVYYDPHAYGYDPHATLEVPMPKRARRRRSNFIYNLVTAIFLLATVGVIVLVDALIRNPMLPINPFPPRPAEPVVAAQEAAPAGEPEATSAPVVAAPPTADPTEQPTATPEATDTPAPTPTRPIAAAPLEPTPTITMVATMTPPSQAAGSSGSGASGGSSGGLSEYPFVLDGEIEASAYTGPEKCEYLGVAGSVVDMNGQPVAGVPIVVEGDEFFESLVLSGSAPEIGPGGYKVQLNDAPVEATFTVQLWSDTGFRISEAVTIETTDSCDENLITVNFIATQPLD